MKIFFLFALLILLTSSVYAQTTPNWIWSITGGTPNNDDFCRGSAIDRKGNTFVTGDFRASFSLGGINITSNGGADCYVGRIRPNGQLAWLKTFGNAGPEVGVDIDTYGEACDAYLTGTYFSSISLGNSVNLPSPIGKRDAFVSKIDSSGNYVWAKSFGSSEDDSGNEVVSADNGDTWATGPFAGNVITFPDGSTANKIGGADDVWVAGFDKNGNFKKGFSLKGTGHEEGRGISIDSQNNVLLAGEFDAGLQLGTMNITSQGNNDIYLIKYDSLGNILFYKHWGNTGADYARGVDADNEGNIYVSGVFSGTVNFDSISMTSNGPKDIFLAKLSSTGTLIWIQKFGGSDVFDEGCEIEVQPLTGDVFVAFNVGSSVILPNNTTLTSASAQNQLVIKFDSTGIVQWAKMAGGNSILINFSIGLDENENVVVAGSFNGIINAGNLTLNGESGGSSDFYILYLSANNITAVDKIILNDKLLNIFPNPANVLINVVCKNGFEIYNSTGQLIKQNSQTTTQINIADLPTGLYILRSDNKVGRFIKTE